MDIPNGELNNEMDGDLSGQGGKFVSLGSRCIAQPVNEFSGDVIDFFIDFSQSTIAIENRRVAPVN